MKRLIFALVLASCGPEAEVTSYQYDVEGMVGSCHIICDYTQEPTVLRVETTPGNLVTCESCYEALRRSFEYKQCVPSVATYDFNPEHCR